MFSFPIDEVFRGHEPGQAANRSVSAADVVLYGVNLILPLMSQDLLKVWPEPFRYSIAGVCYIEGT